MNKIQIKNLKKHFNRYAKTYKVYKKDINEFKEEIDNIYVCDIDGIFYSKSANRSYKINEKGATITKRQYTLQTLDKKEIKFGMYIDIEDKRYVVIDIENEANLNISYLIKLEEAEIHGRG